MCTIDAQLVYNHDVARGHFVFAPEEFELPRCRKNIGIVCLLSIHII